MDFALNDNQHQVKLLAGQIMSDHCSQQQLRECDHNGYFNRELWRSLADAGLLGIAVNESFGGMGWNFETLCVLLETAGHHAAPLPLLNVLAESALVLQRFAPKQADDILPQLLSGDVLLANNLSQRDATSSITVESTSDEQCILSGVTGVIPLADQAQYCLLVSGSPQTPIITWVDMAQAGIERLPQTLTHGEYAAVLQLKHVTATVIASGDAAAQLLIVAEQYRNTASSAYALGLAEAMLEKASEYTGTRQQFGKAIGRFQAVQQQLADAFIQKECLRVATEKAIYELSVDDLSERSRDSALVAKVWLGDALHTISHTTQHVHGGMGVDRDYGLFRYCTQARYLELHGGNSASALNFLGARLSNGLKAQNQ